MITHEVSATRGIKSRSKTFEIGITYCNSVSFAHLFNQVQPAMREYSQLLEEAIEPKTMTRHSRHVRMVTLVTRDELGELVHHISSGVFQCDHREN